VKGICEEVGGGSCRGDRSACRITDLPRHSACRNEPAAAAEFQTGYHVPSMGDGGLPLGRVRTVRHCIQASCGGSWLVMVVRAVAEVLATFLVEETPHGPYRGRV
jgi:hypothetical protein